MYGYARVSTDAQDTALQIDALKAAGVVQLHQEKTSGVGPRPVLHELLTTLQRGDMLVVYKLDRLARSLKDLLQLLDRLKVLGVGIRSLTEPIDTSSAMGEFVLQILGAVAQLERAIINERCKAGRVAARARGVTWGGSEPRLSVERAAELCELRAGGMKIAALSEKFGLGKSSVHRYLSEGKTRPLMRRRAGQDMQGASTSRAGRHK